jgi:hypothetical protein
VSFVGPVSHVRVRPLAAPDQPLMVKVASRAGGLPVGEGAETEVGFSERECHVVTA